MRDYHIYSHENGGYIADIPDLEACSAFDTPNKALAEVGNREEDVA